MKLQTLDLDNNEFSGSSNRGTIGFWKRQFIQKRTAGQTRFDWALGVVIPLGCVVADPVVFADKGLLTEYRPFAYVLSSTSILAMAAWLLWGDRLRWLAAPLGGLFIAGSFISFLVGVILLPYSLLGLFFIIGLLGFTPLFAGLVYLRNGIRAIRAANTVMDETSVSQAATLAAILALVIPYVVNGPVSWTIHWLSI